MTSAQTRRKEDTASLIKPDGSVCFICFKTPVSVYAEQYLKRGLQNGKGEALRDLYPLYLKIFASAEYLSGTAEKVPDHPVRLPYYIHRFHIKDICCLIKVQLSFVAVLIPSIVIVQPVGYI